MARQRLKDLWSEQRLFRGRLIAAGLCVLALTGLLIGRLGHLQIVNYSYFADLSQGNRIRIEPVPPTRGLIYDRRGVLLAENLPTYRLEMIPEQVDDVDATLARLVDMALVEAEDLERIGSLIRSQRRFEPVTLNFRLSDEEVAAFAVRRQHFPGVDIRARLRRHYPFGEVFAHALGYVGGLSAADLERLDRANYAGTSQVGKSGLERAYEDMLHGEVGYRRIVVNARGRALQVIERAEAGVAEGGGSVAPVPGRDLVLALDSRVQMAAYEAMEGRRGAVVAVDTRNGDVVAMLSLPSFDPNLFASGLSQRQYQALLTDRDNPLYNRAIRGQYPPGSTIKPLLGLAALYYDVSKPRVRRMCPGFFSLPGSDHRFRDWRREGHGLVDLHDAIVQSCDVYYYIMAVDLGIDRIHQFLTAFGLGAPTGIDLLGERAGLVPSREWKRRAFSRPSDRAWYPGETVIVGIGQGYMTATPLQLAVSTAALAARGTRYKPRLVTAYGGGDGGTEVRPAELAQKTGIEHEDWLYVDEAMVGVTTELKGTARTAMIGADYRLAGKTGTAQVFSLGQDEEYDEEEIEERLRDHALFVGFAPAEAPELAVAVIVENGGSGGAVATPVARRVLDAWFEANE